ALELPTLADPAPNRLLHTIGDVDESVSAEYATLGIVRARRGNEAGVSFGDELAFGDHVREAGAEPLGRLFYERRRAFDELVLLPRKHVRRRFGQQRESA